MKEKDHSNFGWVIVGVSFIILALAYGVHYSFSLFFVAFLKEYGWSRSITAGAFSLFLMIHAMIGPFVGGMVDRIGPRRAIFLGSLFLGIGLVLCSFIQAWWQFYLFFGVITAIGVGSTGWIPNTTMIQQWIKVRRGLAMGIISSGIGIGIFVCIPSIQYLINRVGWRTTYRIMACFIPLVIGSLAIIFLKKPPQMISSHPTKRETLRSANPDRSIIDKEWALKSWTIQQAMATKQFWLFNLSIFSGSFVAQSVLSHHVAFFVDQGLRTIIASYIVGMAGIASIGGKILWATLSDRIGREVTYTIGIACSICGILLLILFGMFHFDSLPFFYAVFFGMGYAVIAALPPIIAADFFEGQTYGRIFGTMMILSGVGGAFGAWFTGFLYDWVGNYIPAFIILIIFTFMACLSLWWAAPRKIRIVPGKVVKF
jgi:MFS family permease